MNEKVQASPAATGKLVAAPHYLVQWVVLPYLYMSFLFYAIVQLQQWMLGRVFVTHTHVRIFGLIGTLMASIAYALRRSRVRVRQPRLVGFMVLYSAFVVADFVLKVGRGTTTVPAAIYGETYLYFFVFFLPLIFIIADNSQDGQTAIVEQGAFRLLMYVAAPVFLLGFAQVLLNAPILSLGDEAEGYGVEVYQRSDIGQVRAFSVFGSAFTYGHFITLVGVLAIAYMVRKRSTSAGWTAALIGSSLAIISTLTRNAYLEFLLSVCGVLVIPVLINRRWKNSWIIGLSVAAAAVSYAAMIAFLWLTHLQGRGLLNLSTFELRLAGVAAVVLKYFVVGRSASVLAVGQGYMQGDKFATLQGIHPLVFDNTYVDVALFSGVVGLVLFLILFVRLFGYVLTKYRQTNSFWWLALLGMYFSYPLVATLNIYVSQLYLITAMVICYDVQGSRRLKHVTNSPNPASTHE